MNHSPVTTEAPFIYHQEVNLVIETLTNTGLGLGRINGWVIMVPFTIPGEQVRVRIFRNHKNYSDADLIEVLKPAPERTRPTCPLFSSCGGCQYQHMEYAYQLQWKQQQVFELLERLAGITVNVEPTWPSPKIYYYRSKLTPHFKKAKQDLPLKIGFLKQGTHSHLIDVPYCPIAVEPINAALSEQRTAIAKNSTNYPKGSTLLLRAHTQGVACIPTQVITENIGLHKFQFVAGEFFQNNPFILEDFVHYAIEQARDKSITHFVDVYCGVGVFSIKASSYFESCYGIEINSRAIELAKSNATLNNIQNCHFVTGTAEAIFKAILFSGEQTSVLLDPPRKGCDPCFLQQLIEFRPVRIVYVSCAPDTQARDLKTLIQAGYTVARVQPFDLFPQTRHIETVVTLIR